MSYHKTFYDYYFSYNLPITDDRLLYTEMALFNFFEQTGVPFEKYYAKSIKDRGLPLCDIFFFCYELKRK
jgi:hypothetical protein